MTLPASLDLPSDEGGPREVEATTVDFSPRGAGLIAAEAPTPGMVVRVAIEERGRGVRRTRIWSGRVVSVREARAGFRVGVAFLDPEAGPKSRLKAARPGRIEALVRIDPAWNDDPEDAEAFEDAGDAPARGAASTTAYKLFRMVAILGFVADQLTKMHAFARASAAAGGLAVKNYGALGGLTLGMPAVHQLLALGTLTLTGVIGRIALRDRERWSWLDAVGWGGLMAGMLGNAADRLALGYVRDVLHSSMLPHWVFNLADVLAVSGVACLLLARLLPRPEPRAPLPSATAAGAFTCAS